MIGKHIGNYRIVTELGSGAMGEVYYAEHSVMGRRAAIKVIREELSTNEDMVQRFINEARQVNRIGHPNIVEITDFGQIDTRYYIMMELLDGETLEARLERTGTLKEAAALRIAAQVADALGAAHDLGVVHRDLKPENIFLVARGNRNDIVKVLDFGIAKLMHPTGSPGATQPGAILGTPHFMSPEQCRGEDTLDYRSDIYSLGVVLYRMLTGRVPFDSESIVSIMLSQMNDAPRSPRELQPELSARSEAVVLKALEKLPDDRFANMQSFLAALEGKGFGAPPPLPGDTVRPTASEAGEPSAQAGAKDLGGAKVGRHAQPPPLPGHGAQTQAAVSPLPSAATPGAPAAAATAASAHGAPAPAAHGAPAPAAHAAPAPAAHAAPAPAAHAAPAPAAHGAPAGTAHAAPAAATHAVPAVAAHAATAAAAHAPPASAAHAAPTAAAHAAPAAPAATAHATPTAAQVPPAPPPSAVEPVLDAAEEADRNRRVGDRLARILVERIHTGKLVLPSMPLTARDCLALLDKPQQGSNRVAEAIGRDPIIASQVMRRANSALLGRNARVRTIEQAVSRIGVRQLRGLLIDMSARRLFESRNPEIRKVTKGLWEHSTAVGVLSRALAKRRRDVDPEVCYLAGLLHDVGKPVAASLLLEAERSFEDAAQAWLASGAWLGVIQGCHREIGTALARSWDLPEEVWLTIARCERYPLEGAGSPSSVVCFCNAVTKQLGIYPGEVDRVHVEGLIHEGQQMFKIDDKMLENLVAELREQETQQALNE